MARGGAAAGPAPGPGSTGGSAGDPSLDLPEHITVPRALLKAASAKEPFHPTSPPMRPPLLRGRTTGSLNVGHGHGLPPLGPPPTRADLEAYAAGQAGEAAVARVLASRRYLGKGRGHVCVPIQVQTHLAGCRVVGLSV